MSIEANLLKLYLGLFHQYGEPILIALCNCKVPSDVVLETYKKIAPIPEENMAEMMEYAKEKYPDGDEETRLRFVKITHTIGTLL